MDCMENFARFINSIPQESTEDIKVALIDDGIDAFDESITEKIVRGVSFSVREGPGDLLNSYFISSHNHGTAMASIIRRVCPRVKLYVAKLNEAVGEKGMLITLTSAAKVRSLHLRVDDHLPC